MTKTPEELTADWKAGKLPQWKFYYVSYSSGVEPLLLNGENDFINHSRIINPFVKSILAPVPTYDEYKAMQERIADQRAELESARWYQTVQNEDIGKLRGLLKECRTAFEVYAKEDETCGLDENNKYAKHLLTRISTALNETQGNSVADIKIQESEE